MNRHILSIISAAALCASPCLAGLQSVSARHTGQSSPAQELAAGQKFSGQDSLTGTVERLGYDVVIVGGRNNDCHCGCA